MVGYIIGGIALFIFGGCFGFMIACLISASKTIDEIDKIDKIFKEDKHHDETC